MIRVERFPLPGQKVVRDTPVREGRAAIVHGRVLQALAVLLAVAAAALPVVLARVLGACRHLSHSAPVGFECSGAKQ